MIDYLIKIRKGGDEKNILVLKFKSNSDLVSIYLSLPKTHPEIEELIKSPRVSRDTRSIYKIDQRPLVYFENGTKNHWQIF
jgi:hypothetical protein